MDVLKVNEHHQSVIGGYAQLNRYQRQQFLRSVELSINDAINSKLIEDTFTRDEVTELIVNIKKTVIDELEAELINFVQANVLMLSQLFVQAEKWHLQMTIDLSEMQNKELLDAVKNIETLPTKLEKSKLSPLSTPLSTNIEKTSELLRLEILTLQEENQQLKGDSKNLQEKILNVKAENENILAKCEEKDKKIKELETLVHKNTAEKEENDTKTEEQQEADKLLSDYDKVLKEQIAKELEEMKRKVDAAQSQLTLAEMELEKKFSETTAYNNMKVIIAKKNEQIKDLRNRLTKHEPLECMENGDVEKQ